MIRGTVRLSAVLRKRMKWLIVTMVYLVFVYLLYTTGNDLVLFSRKFLLSFMIYLPLTLTLNMEAGYAGIPNFGKLLFFAGGAAFAGSLTAYLGAFLVGSINFSTSCLPILCIPDDFLGNDPTITFGQVDPLLHNNVGIAMGFLLFALLIGALAGAALGFLFSFPAIRLREDYLGMLLLAAAQFFVVFDYYYTPLNFGAYEDMNVPSVFSWAPGPLQLWVAVVFLGAFAGGVYLYVERVARSPLGRKLRGIRDSEVASEALGKDTVATRRSVLIYASAISGMVGALFVVTNGYVGYGLFDRVTWTLWPWVIIVIGGMGNNSGVVFGTFTFTYVLSSFDQLKGTLGSFSFPTFSLVTGAPFLALVGAGLLVLLWRDPIKGWLAARGSKVSGRIVAILGLGTVLGGFGVGAVMSTIGVLNLGSFPIDPNYAEYIFFGSALIILLILKPDGLLPEKSTATFKAGRVSEIARRALMKAGDKTEETK